jgi:hypothetical protein
MKQPEAARDIQVVDIEIFLCSVFFFFFALPSNSYVAVLKSFHLSALAFLLVHMCSIRLRHLVL